MIKVMIFIDYRNLISSQYKVDIFQIDNVITDHLFKITGTNIDHVRTHVFMGGSTESQSQFIENMIRNGIEVEINSQHHSREQEKGTDVAMACRALSLAHQNAYDLGIIVSGDADLLPAIKEIRQLGKRVMVACFEDRVAKIYKDPTLESGPIDLDIFYLDTVIDAIAIQAINDNITIEYVLDEVKSLFFDVNIDYDKIRMKRYITYWATRARYLQTHHDDLSEDDQKIPHRMFDILNDLSNKYRPGYIKALNRHWSPNSWEDEIRRIPRAWE